MLFPRSNIDPPRPITDKSNITEILLKMAQLGNLTHFLASFLPLLLLRLVYFLSDHWSTSAYSMPATLLLPDCLMSFTFFRVFRVSLSLCKLILSHRSFQVQ